MQNVHQPLRDFHRERQQVEVLHVQPVKRSSAIV
jgi:hypothetical protein